MASIAVQSNQEAFEVLERELAAGCSSAWASVLPGHGIQCSFMIIPGTVTSLSFMTPPVVHPVGEDPPPAEEHVREVYKRTCRIVEDAYDAAVLETGADTATTDPVAFVRKAVELGGLTIGSIKTVKMNV